MNNKEFQIPKLKVRNGTDQDASALNECLSNLGFKVARFDSLTAKDMRFHLKEGNILNVMIFSFGRMKLFVCVSSIFNCSKIK